MKNAWWVIPLCLVALFGLDLLCGDGLSIPRGDIFWKIRLPRVLTALVAGAAMALAGAQMQAIFRNPLADPHIMGVSGGAGLGASIAVIAASSMAGGISLVSAAFAGGLAAGFLIMGIASRTHSTGSLLLAGVMMGFIFSAVSSILQYKASEEGLKLFYSWMAGSFSSASYSSLTIMAGALVICSVIAIAMSKSLDLVLFGDTFARLSGAPLKSIRFRAIATSALLTGAVTAFCGPIGFVGIAAPHLTRSILGTSAHKKILPASLATGASVALAGDFLAHVGSSPLPVGCTLALVGIPMILVLMRREKL